MVNQFLLAKDVSYPFPKDQHVPQECANRYQEIHPRLRYPHQPQGDRSYHSTLHASYQLALGKRRSLEMQTTHHTIRTHTLVILAELHLVYITITASTLFYKQLHLSVFEKSYFIIVLQKISCTRQFESQLSLRSFALSFRVKDCLSALLHLFGFQFVLPLKMSPL